MCVTNIYTLGTDNHNVLLKDSLYSAIGLAAASLEHHLDFNAFLEHTMVAEVQSQEPEYKLLRRRIALVLGQWVPVKPGELNMNAIYQIFQHLLGKHDPLNDLVVRITAGRQLRSILDSYEFSAGAFMSFAPTILESLMSLVQEVESSDTKMGLLETVRMVVVKMEEHVSCCLVFVGGSVTHNIRSPLSPTELFLYSHRCGKAPAKNI